MISSPNRYFRFAVSARLTALLLVACSAFAQSTPKEVLLTVSVTNQRGQVITGLEQDRFAVFEGKNSYQIASFSNKNEATSVAILVDMSGSMAADKQLPMMARWVARFMRAGNSRNEYMILGFDIQPRVVTKWSSDERELLSTLDLMAKEPAKHETALYDAMAVGLRQVQSRNLPKRAMVVLSDFVDTESKSPYRQIRRLLQESDVILYGVMFTSAGQGSAGHMEASGILDDLTTNTGGSEFEPKTRDEFDRSADHIGFELQNQYILGFKMNSGPNPQFHSLKVRVMVPASGASAESNHFTVRHRLGVYVP